MNQHTLHRLISINQEFYQNFGYAFAQTRRRIQPGVRWALEKWGHDGDWLDLGCGNGALAQAWQKTGLKGSYTGVDFSLPLLAEAQNLPAAGCTEKELQITFRQVNLAEVDWVKEFKPRNFDGIVSFAVLHHLPGAALRERMINQAASLLKPHGLMILSVWQFQNSAKLLARVQPWARVGISENEVEEGDTLLDWRYHPDQAAQANGLRYVHLFTREELARLRTAGGFTLLEEFESDGQGGRLGLYQVWRAGGSSGGSSGLKPDLR